MKTITWVGINHYIENEEELKGFYDKLRVGDVVRLVPEPSNFWDAKAVAVYHNFVMRGYISRHQTGTVHAMVESSKELVGRVVDDIDAEINQVKIVVDSVETFKEPRADYPRLPKSALGVRMRPHIMYEESSYRQIREEVEAWAHCICTHSLDDEVVGVALKKIKDAIATYLTIWDHSISIEANVLPRYFDTLLTDLSEMGTRVKDELKGELRALRHCTAQQPKPTQTMKTFTKQMEALDAVYAKENGVYALFDEKCRGRRGKLEQMLRSQTEWLHSLSSHSECCFDEDYNEFVHMIYCKGYHAEDLYMIITHLLFMQRTASLLYGKMADIPVNVNIYGKAQCNFKNGSRNTIHA